MYLKIHYFTNDGIVGGGDLVENSVNPLQTTFVLNSNTVVLLVVILQFTTSEPEIVFELMAVNCNIS